MTHTTSHISKDFNLGSLRLANRLVQAPMAGISGRAFRLQARRFGAGLVSTEMISSYGVHFGNRRTVDMLDVRDAEHPVAVQLFGNQPELMAEAALAAERAGADIIDINMGCPVRKVVKTGAGVALMEDEPLAARVTAAVVGAVRVPVTVKIRSGARARATAASLAPRLAAAGAAAVSIHPRTGAQGYRGRADHTLTRQLAATLPVPVIASGDIAAPALAEELLDAGCAAVMVGQAALGNPWIFADLLAGAEPHRRPLDAVLTEMGRFNHDLTGEVGEERAGRAMRKFYGWYLRPFKPDARLRDQLRRAAGFAAAEPLIRAALGDRPRD